MTQKLEIIAQDAQTTFPEQVCPQQHPMTWHPDLFGYDASEGAIDVNGIERREPGLYCTDCKIVYGASRLTNKTEQKYSS